MRNIAKGIFLSTILTFFCTEAVFSRATRANARVEAAAAEVGAEERVSPGGRT